MKTIKGLSPTSIHLWESDRDEFYLKYLSDASRPDQIQTDAMSVGSAFDAFVKSSLHWHIFGNYGENETYQIDNLLAQQVSAECMTFARRAGKECFDRYRVCGCYDELLEDMLKSEVSPRFEFTLYGNVGGVPLMGKPDCWYRRGVDVTLDWKVEGFCSKYSQSPKKLHKTCRDTWEPTDECKATRGGGEPKAHKNYSEMDHYGHKIGAHWLEEVDKKWADQIATYSWLLGMPVGDEETITCIDQLACKPHPLQKTVEQPLFPLIRVAQHRCRISSYWQHCLLERYQTCWNALQSGHIFDDLSIEESKARCEVLDMQQPTDGQDDLWAMMNERQYRG
jgi:hypothetical protein